MPQTFTHSLTETYFTAHNKPQVQNTGMHTWTHQLSPTLSLPTLEDAGADYYQTDPNLAKSLSWAPNLIHIIYTFHDYGFHVQQIILTHTTNQGWKNRPKLHFVGHNLAIRCTTLQSSLHGNHYQKWNQRGTTYVALFSANASPLTRSSSIHTCWDSHTVWG